MDFSLGAISFMDFDEIVEKLKMVASAAPAFAFKMAIDTVCSQCATIMQDLEEIINMINNMSLDACKMAENIGNGIGHALGSSISSPGSGGFSDSYSAISDGIRTVGGYTSMVTGAISSLDDITIKSRFYGSFLNYVKEHSSNDTVKQFIPHLIAIAGDFGIIIEPGKEKATHKTHPGNLDEIEKLYKAFLEPSSFNNWTAYTPVVVSGAGDVPSDIRWDLSTGSLTPDTGLDSAYYELIVEIIGNMSPNGNKLTSADISALQELPKNGYKILNAIYALGDGSGNILPDQETYLRQYSRYVALNYLTEMLQNTISATKETISDYTKSLTVTEDGKLGEEKMEEYFKKLKEVSDNIKKVHHKKLQEFKDFDTDRYQKQLEAQIKNSLK